MKLTITALLLTLSLNILAQDSVSFLSLNHSKYMSYSTKYVINKDLGRAWIQVESEDESYDEEWSNEYDVKIEGLAYESALSAITYTDASGIQTICANYIDNSGRMFRYSKIVTTGDCKISKEFGVVSVDNGFVVKKSNKVRFIFSVNN